MIYYCKILATTPQLCDSVSHCHHQPPAPPVTTAAAIAATTAATSAQPQLAIAMIATTLATATTGATATATATATLLYGLVVVGQAQGETQEALGASREALELEALALGALIIK